MNRRTQRLRMIFSRRNVGLFLAANALVGVGFYQGAHWVQPKADPLVLSEYDTVPDDRRFAVTEQRGAYALVEDVVKDGTGAILPGSAGTQEIDAFRGHVLRLDKAGALLVYRPRLKTWVALEVPPLKSLMTLQNEIVGLSRDGEILLYRDEEGGALAFDGDRALIGGKPIQFQSLGRGYHQLASETLPGFFKPATVVALGEDVLVLKTRVPPQIIEHGTPEHQDLLKRLGR